MPTNVISAPLPLNGSTISRRPSAMHKSEPKSISHQFERPNLFASTAV